LLKSTTGPSKQLSVFSDPGTHYTVFGIYWFSEVHGFCPGSFINKSNPKITRAQFFCDLNGDGRLDIIESNSNEVNPYFMNRKGKNK
jgi:hypothetical protein